MLGRLIAISMFSRRTDCLTGPAKVIDGDTIVVAEELHGIDAPEMDQTFWWRWAGSRTGEAESTGSQSAVFQRVRRPRCVSWIITAAPASWQSSASRLSHGTIRSS